MVHAADRLVRRPPARSATPAAVEAAPTRRRGVAERWLAWGALLAVVALGIGAPAQRTGDAHQYHAMAAALAELRPPALTPAETIAYKRWLQAQPVASGFPAGVRAVDQPVLVQDRRQEFSHFWVYPLLAAPVVAIGDRLGLHRADAFLTVNALLLGAMLWAIGRWSQPVVGLLLLGTPLVWFVDKAQVELFTVAFLGLAMVAAGRGRFLWAAFLAAVAATQNLPIAAAVPVFWSAGIVRAWRARPVSAVARRRLPTAPEWTVIAATAALTLLHPAYYLWRLGVATPQELNGGIAAGLPPLGRYLAVLIDPNLGLLPWVPLLALATIAGGFLLVLSGRGEASAACRDLRPAALCALVIGGWFLAAFSQTSNVNSGGTLHVSRYALWLLPLTIPFLEALARRLKPRRPLLLPVLGGVAFAAYAVLFRPSQAERYVVPSPQAELAAAWFPAASFSPAVPEIFYERQQGVDGGVAGSAANRACTVVLLIEGAAEPPCAPTGEERVAAARLHAEGWSGVWLVRPGRLDSGRSEVAGAVRR